MKSGIYKIINILDNKIYVGSSIDIEKRLKRHKKDLLSNRHHSAHLQRAWNFYGQSYFSFEILEFCDPSLLLLREQFYLDKYKSYVPELGYNICENAGNTLGRKTTEKTKKILAELATGRKQTEQTKILISKKLKNHKKSKEHINKISEATKERLKDKTKHPQYGKKISEETKNKIKATLSKKMNGVDNPFYGKKHSQESIKKISEKLSGRTLPEQTKKKMRRFTEEQEKEIIEKYNSGILMKDIAKQYNCCYQTISSIIKRLIE